MSLADQISTLATRIATEFNTVRSQIPPLINRLTTISDPTNQFYEQINVVDDGSASSGWPNRFVFQFSGRNVSYFNEYGELRIIPGKSNTVALRTFVREFNTDPARDMNTPMLEVQDSRDNRNSLWAVMPDGSVQRNALPMAGVYVTANWASDPNQASVPPNTLIVETG